MTKTDQIYQDIKKKILLGSYLSDKPLPSENHLAIQYGVSRITSKNALNRLAEDGLVVRKQGKGTFVRYRLKEASKILVVLPFQDRYGNYVEGIRDYIKDSRWQMVRIDTTAFVNLSLERLREFAGIILYPQEGNEKEMSLLVSLYLENLPIVLIDKSESTLPFASVTSDNKAGGAIASEHLLNKGRENIAFFSQTKFWEDFTTPTALRFMGYLETYHHYKKDIDIQRLLKLSKKLQINRDFNAIVEILTRYQIDGLIFENDMLATYVIELFRINESEKLQQIGIVGFDDLSSDLLLSPKLSSIHQNFFDIGKKAIERLLEQMLSGKKGYHEQDILPVYLVERESSK